MIRWRAEFLLRWKNHAVVYVLFSALDVTHSVVAANRTMIAVVYILILALDITHSMVTGAAKQRCKKYMYMLKEK